LSSSAALFKAKSPCVRFACNNQNINSITVLSLRARSLHWTEEDKETFRAAFGLLTNDQRMELMNILAPAINRGEITVEVTGPLF